MHFKIVIIFTVLVLGQVIPAFAKDMPDIEKLVNDVESRADINAAAALVNKIQSAPADKRSEKILEEVSKKPQFVHPLKDTAGPIATEKGVDLNRMLSRYQPKMEEAQDKPRKLNQLLIFVSLSMPKASLTALNIQAKKAGGLLVLRGLVNNSFKETAKLLQDAGVDVAIDPRLFEAFAVDAVPAFVVLPTDTHPCADKACKFTPLHDKATGNVSLEYALERISRGGKVSNKVASSYLAKLRGQL